MDNEASKPKRFVQHAATIEKIARDGQFDQRSLGKVAAMMREIGADLQANGVLKTADGSNQVYLRRGKALAQALADFKNEA